MSKFTLMIPVISSLYGDIVERRISDTRRHLYIVQKSEIRKKLLLIAIASFTKKISRTISDFYRPVYRYVQLLLKSVPVFTNRYSY
jgi:ABC-type long-subunit fatty acid transport system fused permease/ATPase subunit